MKTEFAKAIKAYLDKRASTDKLFAESYKKENKSIDECCNYIIGEVQKIANQGRAALTDDEVFGMAVHYYDEDNIKAEKKINAKVIVSGKCKPENNISQKTEEKPKKTVKKDSFDDRQLSLFGF